MTHIIALDFITKINDLEKYEFVEEALSDELQRNEVLLEIDKFSFTANNITYGVLGEEMNYWKFFPTRAGYGIIPVWGFANVIASNHPDISVGQRYYGYYPMSSHLRIKALKVTESGFIDGSEHRKMLPSVYNFYTNVKSDPTITPETEGSIATFRPLFVTSFLIDAHLAEKNFFGATQILITSASSKTAQALACLLAHRKKDYALNWGIIGLTSKKNTAFVKRLNWYDQTISYDEITHLNPNEKYIIVDFAGNHNMQSQLQILLGNNLLYNCLVGFVDWRNLEGENHLLKKGEFFFAPDHATKRQKEWGRSKFQQNIGVAWQQFMHALKPTTKIKEHFGKRKVEQLYLDTLNGKANPGHVNIVSLSK